jgi:formylglycine-generating enzyme required for sulfatase activity
MKRCAELFEEAIGLQGDARAVFLDRACGDDAALRAEVESLLDAHDAAGSYLGAPTSALDEAETLTADVEGVPPSRVIGRYKLLQQVGEGGFGTVWMAEQREPVKRRVAVKIIKAGMDTGQVIARFEAERQALAMMDHPNIAKVLDGGSTDTGRPYFVMEYITGVPILEYCDTEKLDTAARLDLFRQACLAIQHAHQKGIIHRDIKPSNVMITLHDGTPVVKVIDFGIAKATNVELTTRTLFTAHHQMLGTPAYMSPEQAEMSGLDIDTRSDIYSLGVLLYELLTGTTPFATEQLLEGGWAEMMRIIREDEPPKPSTRLSSLGATATRTAAQRHVDVRRLGLLLRGDLDWIVMKCLEKERSRRYETAEGLAADVARHLANEPVAAGPPSASYRFRKFVRRHRGGAFAATIVAVAIVLGGAGTVAGLLRASSAEATARALQPQADEYVARTLIEQVGELWPPDPDDPAMIPSLEAWVAAARQLTPALAEYRVRLEAALARAEGANAADRAEQDLLTRLVTQLTLLGDEDAGLLATDAAVPGHGWSVPKRLAFAQGLAAGFGERGEHTAAWTRARRDGLRIDPQMGLIPIGRDPTSGLWEFAHLMTGEPAERGDNEELVLTEDTGIVLILIPGGTFTQGPHFGRKIRVELSPYFVSKYELTQGQWKRLTGDNPSAYGPDAAWNDDWLVPGAPASLLHPVEQVSWYDCDRWLRRADLALPSEAQWEYATRAGTETMYSTGDDRDSLIGAANIRDVRCRDAQLENWGRYAEWLDDGGAVHWAVGTGAPNSFGLHEVHGNVSEWILDAYAPYPEGSPEPMVDRVVAVSSDARFIKRGGSWRGHAAEARSRARYFWPPGFSGAGLGVRPARSVSASPAEAAAIQDPRSFCYAPTASSSSSSATGQFSSCPLRDFSETKPEWVRRTCVAAPLGASSIRRMVSAPCVPTSVPFPVIHVISMSSFSATSRNRP